MTLTSDPVCVKELWLHAIHAQHVCNMPVPYMHVVHTWYTCARCTHKPTSFWCKEHWQSLRIWQTHGIARPIIAYNSIVIDITSHFC